MTPLQRILKFSPKRYIEIAQLSGDALVAMLREEKISPDAVDTDGEPLLVLVRTHANVADQVRALLQYGANPNVTSACSMFPLSLYLEHLDIVQLLLSAGADPLSAPAGQSAVEEAWRRRLRPQLELLRAHLGDAPFRGRGTAIACESRSTVDLLRGGACGMRRTAADSWELKYDLWALEGTMEEAAAAITQGWGGVTHHGGEQRKVGLAWSMVPLFQLRTSPWVVAFAPYGGHWWAAEYKTKVVAVARALPSGRRFVAIAGDSFELYKCGELVEEVDFSQHISFEETEERAARRNDQDLRAEADRWLADKQLTLPFVRDVSDGLMARLKFRGIARSDIARVSFVDDSSVERIAVETAGMGPGADQVMRNFRSSLAQLVALTKEA